MFNWKALFGLRQRVAVRNETRFVEPLESRQLLSGGPVVTGVHIIGAARAITGIVVSFNESLDPASAQDTLAYRFGRPIPHTSDSTGPSLGDFLPFLARPKVRLVKQGKIQFASATYDDATHSVTLTPYKRFNGAQFFRVLRVIGSGTHVVKDVAGNPVDGNSDGTGGDDAVIRWVKKNNNRIAYRDGDGDRVALTLRGRGTLYVFKSTTFFTGAWVFVDHPRANTVLSGNVTQSANGDGKAVIPELEGAGGINNGLANNPQFVIQSTET
jgi:hypothetical protein